MLYNLIPQVQLGLVSKLVDLKRQENTDYNYFGIHSNVVELIQEITVYRILYNVHCTLYTVLRTPSTYTVLRTPYVVHRTLYTVRCTPYVVHRTLYTVRCTLYVVQCMLYTVRRTLYVVHCTLYG